MTNAEFLTFMFDDRPLGSMPLGCSFWQHPDDVIYWTCRPLSGDPYHSNGVTEKFAADMSNYVAVNRIASLMYELRCPLVSHRLT